MMRRLRLPNPALVISLVTLSLVLGGTAVAATTSGDNKEDTKLVKALAPSLSVKHATTADSATNATSAVNATTATHATSANSATNATTATDATKLGGQLPSFYLPASAVQTFGPTTVPACTTVSCPGVPLITLGKFTFDEVCQSFGGLQGVTYLLRSSTSGSSWAETSSNNYTPNSNPNLGGVQIIAGETIGAGTPEFVSVNGEALSSDGHGVSYNLYMGQDARGASDDSCVFGGSFIVS